MDFFKLESGCEVRIPAKADKALIQQLLHGYAYGVDFVISTSASACEASFGVPTAAKLTDGEYAINTIGKGVAIAGKDFACTMRGFVTVLNSITQSREDKKFQIPCGKEEDKPAVQFRSVHLCLFPETTYDNAPLALKSTPTSYWNSGVLTAVQPLRSRCRLPRPQRQARGTGSEPRFGVSV